MREQFLNDPDDMKWLFEVHISRQDEWKPDRPMDHYQSAVMYGNEDSPERIELFYDTRPHYEDEPIAVIDFYEDDEND